MVMRINKYLASCGVASRRKAEQFILDGLVKINGEIVKDLSKIVGDSDIVSINDQVIKPAQDFVYYILNKPKGYITTMCDDRNRKSILDLTSEVDKRIFPVGRLDYDSEGLIILTNDGDLTYKLTHPKFEIQKKYIVKIEGKIKESELAVLRAGVVINGVRYKKCKVEVIGLEQNKTKLQVILTEGKNREIRNMFEAIGKEVLLLKRVEMAGIKLGGLKRGEVRKLKPFEVEYLKMLAENKSCNNKT